MMFVGASRLSFRIVEEVLRTHPSSHQRVLVYGAGDSGERTLRELRRTPSLGREVIGFVDDNRWKHRTQIHGVPVLGGLDRLDDYLDQHEVDEVIVPSEKISPDRLEMLAECCD